MFKKIIILFSLMSTCAFSEIRDGINLFNKEEMANLEKEVDILEKKYKIKIFVLTLDSSGEKLSDGMEKSIIVSLEQESDKKIKVSETFSQDLNMEEKEEELDTLIDSLSNYLFEKKYALYVEELLKNSLNLYTIEEIEEEASVDEQAYLHYYKWKIIKWIVIVLTILNILVRIRRVGKQKIIRAALEKNN